MLPLVLLGLLVLAGMRSAAFPAGPVCYLYLYALEDEVALLYSNAVLFKDEAGRDVYVNEGYKENADGSHFHYIEHCYRSGHFQSDATTDQAAFDAFPGSGPFAIGTVNLDIGAALGRSAFRHGGDPRLVFGTPGRPLFKRQNGTVQDDNSALDDLNRVSEAIGGSDNVLDLSSGTGDATTQSPAGSALGDDVTPEGNAPKRVFGQESPLGFGLGRPLRKPSPTSTGPKIVKLSTVDAQTAVVHSDSRQSPTAAFGVDPFFTTPSVFVAATPSLGPAPGSLSSTALIGTLGTATPASLSSSPLTLDSSSTSRPSFSSLFVTVAGAPSPTGSVTTIVH